MKQIFVLIRIAVGMIGKHIVVNALYCAMKNGLTETGRSTMKRDANTIGKGKIAAIQFQGELRDWFAADAMLEARNKEKTNV